MIGVNKMKLKMFYKTNKRFFITLSLVVVINTINYLLISSSETQELWLKSFTMWNFVMFWDIGGVIVALMPIFIFVGSSNNILDSLNFRFINCIHIRKSKIKQLFREIIKSGTLGGIIAFLPQFVTYILSLILFDQNNDILFIQYHVKRLSLESGYAFAHYSLLLMFLYGFAIALYGIFMSLLIKRKALYILISFVIYLSLLLYLPLVDEKFHLFNFYSPTYLPKGIYSFSYFITINLIVIAMFTGLISYLFIEKYVEDELYA